MRAEAGRDPHDRGLQDLVGELSTRSETFRRLWGAHNVRTHGAGTKRFHHPVVGELTLAYEELAITAEPGLVLMVYTAEPGSPSAERLRLLASWAASERRQCHRTTGRDRKNLMKITPSSSETASGPADWFTGDVYIDGSRSPADRPRLAATTSNSYPARAPRGTTTPRARPSTSLTASGTSPAAAASREIRPGDVVYIEAGEEHWHGATPGRFMAHVAIQEARRPRRGRDLARARDRRGIHRHTGTRLTGRRCAVPWCGCADPPSALVPRRDSRRRHALSRSCQRHSG